MRVHIVGGLTPTTAILYHSTGEVVLSLRARIDHRCLLSIGDRVAVTDMGAILHGETWEPAMGVQSHPIPGPQAPARLWPTMLEMIDTLRVATPKGTR